MISAPSESIEAHAALCSSPPGPAPHSRGAGRRHGLRRGLRGRPGRDRARQPDRRPVAGQCLPPGGAARSPAGRLGAPVGRQLRRGLVGRHRLPQCPLHLGGPCSVQPGRGPARRPSGPGAAGGPPFARRAPRDPAFRSRGRGHGTGCRGHPRGHLPDGGGGCAVRPCLGDVVRLRRPWHRDHRPRFSSAGASRAPICACTARACSKVPCISSLSW